MAITQTKCPKCNGDLVPGHAAEVKGGVGTMGLYWIEGPPANRWAGGGAKIPIIQLRCSSCGFLESYARLESEPQ